MDDFNEVPANFMCSISGAIMLVAADGLSYERVMIERLTICVHRQ